MKKFLLSILTIALALTIAACSKNINDDEVKDVWGVTLKISDQTRDYIDVEIYYDGTEVDGELETGQYFTIEKYDEETKEWNAVEIYDDLLVFDEMAYILSSEKPVKITHVLEAFKMSNGHFRLGKEIHLYRAPRDFDKEMYYVEFDEKSYQEEILDDVNEEEELGIFGVLDDAELMIHEDPIEQEYEIVSDPKWSYNASITSDKNGTYKLALSGNPTTGSTWNVYNQSSTFRGTLAYVDGECEYVSSVDNSKLPPEKQIVGAGGTFYFTIKEQSPKEEYEQGVNKETTLTFRYYRTWEGADKFIAECNVIFTLNPDGTLSYNIIK